MMCTNAVAVDCVFEKTRTKVCRAIYKESIYSHEMEFVPLPEPKPRATPATQRFPMDD